MKARKQDVWGSLTAVPGRHWGTVLGTTVREVKLEQREKGNDLGEVRGLEISHGKESGFT